MTGTDKGAALRQPIDIVTDRRWFDDVCSWARHQPHATAIRTISGDAGLTYAELWSSTGRIARRLRDAGLRQQAAVLVFLDNSIWYPAVMIGCHRAGLVVVVAGPWSKPDEIAHQVSDAQCQAIVTDPEHVDLVAAAAPNVPLFLITNAPGEACSLLDVGVPAANSWDDGDVTPTTRATLLYTSGTTGRPKGAVFDNGNYTFHGEVSNLLYGYGPDDVGLTFFPLSLAHGHFYQMATWLMAGMEMILAPFSASGFPAQVIGNGVTVLTLNATHMKMIAARATPDPRSRTALRFIKMGLELPVADAMAFEESFGGPLVRSYSQTESVGPVISWRPGNRQLDNNGRPVLGYELQVWDLDEQPIDDAEPGQLVIRSAHPHALFRGYHNQPTVTADGFRGGWWRTGDLVRRRRDGCFEFLGRTKDIIKRSGFNIAAAEIERALTDHLAVTESAVISRPDPVRDEEIVAFVLLRADDATSTEELHAHCLRVLSDYKVPQRIEVLDELPRTVLGKVDKKALAAWAMR